MAMTIKNHDNQRITIDQMCPGLELSINHSTLLSAGKTTNFIYVVDGPQMSDEDMSRINAITTRSKIIDRVRAIHAQGCSLVYDSMENITFYYNLLLMDQDIPHILSHLLLTQITYGVSNIKELIKLLKNENPMNYPIDGKRPFYEYKIKHFLTAAALGMQPSKSWAGRYDANGRNLNVMGDGDVLCHHFYDRNKFEDFLFANTYLERACTTKHDYA